MLVQQRDSFRDNFINGGKPTNKLLEDYRKHRNSELWRASRSHEELCEYILYLEEKIDE